MVTGEKFNGPAELKAILLKNKDVFARNVTEKMYAYALNRGIESYDVPTVRRTAKALAATDYRVNTLVLENVKTYPFQNRRGTAAVATNP